MNINLNLQVIWMESVVDHFVKMIGKWVENAEELRAYTKIRSKVGHCHSVNM